MKNCLILGSGRSGTSMVAGSIASSGYHLGENLHAARVSNPYGFFEDAAVNDLNDELLASVRAPDCALGTGQRWLAIPASTVSADQPDDVRSRIAQLVSTTPFCLKDPRFCFTLPAWQGQLPDDTRFICVFRHPSLTATSIVRECETAPYLSDVEVDVRRALGIWTAMYQAVFEMANDSRWLFVHYDQMFSANGRSRVEKHLGIDLDANLIDDDLRRMAERTEAPVEQMQLYESLCERAEHTEGIQAPAPRSNTRVGVMVPVMPGEESLVEDTVRSVRDQRGVDTSVLVLDTTGSIGQVEGATVLSVTVPSLGPAVALGLDALSREAAPPDLVALAIPGTTSLPNRLARAVRLFDERPATELVTCAHHVIDEYGQFINIVHETAVGDAPHALWQAGLVARRATLRELSTTAFAPVELQLLRQRRQLNPNRIAHVGEPGFAAPMELALDRAGRAANDVRLADLSNDSRTGVPTLLVSLCTFNRRDVLAESLEAFARQELPPGTFEIVVTNDGSSDGTAELLDALELDIPFRVVHQENKGLSAARNAGMRGSDAHLVMFVNDDTIPAFDCVERHLEAHVREAGPVAVLGTFEQPHEAMRNALTRYLETSNKVFGYQSMQDGQRYDCMKFMTCNVSVPLRSVRQVGSFDEAFRHYGCEDTDLGLRLETLGYEVVYDSSARAVHRHILSFADLRNRQHTVAAAFVHLFRKHPHALNAWGISGATVEGCQTVLVDPAQLDELETLAARLAEVDLSTLQKTARVREILANLQEAIDQLNSVWWAQGYIEGFERFGMTGFTDLDASSGPWSIAPDTTRHVLAWPDWTDDASLRTVMELAQPLANDLDFSLLLYCDPEQIDAEVAVQTLHAAFDSVLDGEVDLDITFEARRLPLDELRRIGAAVSAFIVSGTESKETLDAIAAERLSTLDAVDSWVNRFEGVSPNSPTPIAHEAWRSADGMIADAEARHLFDLAREVEGGVIVEVGSYRGRSTVALAAGADKGHGVPVYAIEPHETFTGILGGDFGPIDRGNFMQNMLTSGAYRNVRLVNLSSEVVTPGWTLPVGLLWIDGDHSYEGVRRDYECWAKHLLPDALVAFDDATDPDIGPWQLLAELIEDGELEEVAAVGRVRTLRLLRTALSLDEYDASVHPVRSAA